MIVLFKKIADFILFSSLFIASCAVAFCMETNILLGLPLNHYSFYFFVFGATLALYNLHYFAKTIAAKNSQRLAWSIVHQKTHVLLLALGIGLILVSFLNFHLKHFIILLCFGGIAFLYSFPFLPFGKRKRIKDYGFAKIMTITLMWTLVTVWFPVNTMPFDKTLFAFVFVKRFIFMFVLCLLFDVRDMEIDGREGIHTVPVKIGRAKSYRLSYALLLLFVGMSLAQYAYLPQLNALLPMLLSAAVTFFVIELTKKSNTDYLFLAGIDGMMLLQALLVWLFSLNL